MMRVMVVEQSSVKVLLVAKHWGAVLNIFGYRLAVTLRPLAHRLVRHINAAAASISSAMCSFSGKRKSAPNS